MMATPTISKITPQYLDEREWFKKKYEREIGKIYTRDECAIDKVGEYLKRHEKFRCTKEISMYKEYVELPRPDNIPDVVWNGPLMKRCKCPMKECDCKGNILLPPRRIPCETRYTWHPMYYLRALTCHKLWQPPEPQTTFAQRLQEFVDAELHACKKLQEIGALERGAEFCIYRCFFYHLPEAKRDYELVQVTLSVLHRYFTLKRQILEAYKNRIPPPVMEQRPQQAPVEEEEGPIIDGFYRSLSTQSNTGPNGEFIMGKTSHILFASMNDSILYDIEGKELNISSYNELEEIPKIQTITSKLDKLFSFKGIKSEISKLTTNFFSSLIEIKDTGIPVTSRATQDPPLDHCYQSIKEIPLKGYTNDDHVDTCPCCKFYKMTSFVVTSNIFEQNPAIDDYMIKSDSNTDSKLLINPTKKQSFNDIKNEKIPAGNVGDKSNKLSSSTLNNIPQVIDSLSKINIENEQIPSVSKNLTDENKNIDMKLLLKSQGEDIENDIIEMGQSMDDNKLNDQINNITSSDKNIRDTFDNVAEENKPHEILSSNESKASSKVNQLQKTDLKFDEKHHEKILSTLINIENKVIENLPVAENKGQNQANTTNEISNDILKTIESSYNSNTNEVLKDTLENIDQPSEFNKKIASVSHINVNFIEESQVDNNLNSVSEKRATSKTEVQMILNSNTILKFCSTQKPSVKKLTLKNLERLALRNRITKAISYENIKLHVKKSFQKTSSAFAAIFNCVDFKSYINVNNPKETSYSNDILKEEQLVDNLHDHVEVARDSNKKESSEKEMFSLQYNSNLMTDAESSEGKCIADKIEATIHNDKDNLYSENTRENEVTEEADEVETIDLYLNNALKLSNEAKTGNSVLKLFSQTNQESDAYECTVNSIPAKDTQMKPVSHIQENICTKYSKNILQNTQKTESIMDNNETTIKENNELKLPIQNKQETINENQLETTVNKYKEIKLSLQNTQDNVFYANKIEANNNSKFLLQEKNEQNIDGRTSDDKKLNENLINNGTTDPTTIFNKNLIDLQSINKGNQEIKVKTAINEDKKLKIPLQSAQENVCDASKIETYKNSELLLQDKHVENTDEKLITNKNKKIVENFIDNTHSTADSATIKNKYLKDLLNTQKSRNEHKEKTMSNVDKELKLPFKNTHESIRDESKIEISKTSPLLLQTKQKNETKVDKEKTMTNEDTKLQLFSKDKQDIISEKDMKKITINNGNNISKTFHNIKQSIKQFKKLKFKNYLKKRKEKKAAVTLEKEKLKNMSKTAQEIQNEYKISEEVEWFKNQYERYIGMPKTKETNPAYVLGYLRMKAYCRYVPEAKGQCFFKSVSKEPSDSVFLSWNGPRLPKCTCPYKECFCRGDMILKSKKIPISQIAPELCLMRCQHYKKQGDKRTIKYLLIDFKEQNQASHENEREDITQNTDPIEEEKDDRVCNNYSCTGKKFYYIVTAYEYID
ncbi:unnamed protein product [Euphydryas editha]|uniref:Uncharacterized protein n=1 Tax=Euphydryas editha TaxID=104508 RepID=A0AAU9V019_EUPED|nr:unnamed protein product [Euphydryas editha]